MATYQYWQHFLALEADFAATSRYTEFSEQNFATYSIEYVKLLLAVGSEIDVLCKVICEKLDDSAKRKNINDYRKCLTARTEIASEEILIRRYDLSFKPWESWAQGNNPSWWESFNNVKHERDTSFSEANLENCANAISALFAIVIYCHKAENRGGDLEPYPILLGRDKEPSLMMFQQGYSVPPFK